MATVTLEAQKVPYVAGEVSSHRFWLLEKNVLFNFFSTYSQGYVCLKTTAATTHSTTRKKQICAAEGVCVFCLRVGDRAAGGQKLGELAPHPVARVAPFGLQRQAVGQSRGKGSGTNPLFLAPQPNPSPSGNGDLPTQPYP